MRPFVVNGLTLILIAAALILFSLNVGIGIGQHWAAETCADQESR